MPNKIVIGIKDKLNGTHRIWKSGLDIPSMIKTGECIIQALRTEDMWQEEIIKIIQFLERAKASSQQPDESLGLTVLSDYLTIKLDRT